jgi:flagellar hook-basal body complex protein FliE
MVSPINPLSVDALAGLRGTAAERARTRTEEPSGAAGGFGSAVTQALDDLAASHQRTAEAARKAATGDLQSVSDYMIVASEAQLATQITTAVRNRAIEAFNDIMRMQI